MNASEPNPRPDLDEAAALELLESAYGLAGRLEPLPSYEDQNFRVTTGSGDCFVLKIWNARHDPAFIELQDALLAFLAERELGFAVPETVLTTGGEPGFAAPAKDGATHWVGLLTYLDGDIMAGVRPRTHALLESLGECMGKLDHALLDFESTAAPRPDFLWDLTQAHEVMAANLEYLRDADRRATVEAVRHRFETDALGRLAELPRSVVHNDANDHNLLVGPPGLEERRVVGLLDFGDAHETATVFELAICSAYAIMGSDDPLGAIMAVVRGYHGARPLSKEELDVLFPLIEARLAVSVSMSASSAAAEPDKPYLKVSEAPGWDALERLSAVHPRLARDLFRETCGLEPCPRHHAVTGWLESHRAELGPVVHPDLRDALVFDLSAASPLVDDLDQVLDAERFSRVLLRSMEEAGVAVAVGRYAEPRVWYATDSYARAGGDFPERRTVHTAVDLFLPAGSPVLAPLGGRIHSFRDNAERLDYGPTIILEHAPEGGPEFYSLYGHLSQDSLEGLEVGLEVRTGQEIGRLGDYPDNGDWPPHLHFQLITDLLDMEGNFPGVALPSQKSTWLSISPDPGLVIDLPDGSRFHPPPPAAHIRAARDERLSPSLSLSYREPLHIVRGWRQHLIDADGQSYLDAVNNVCHVGHCHPRVVAAARRQMGVLNTNTRYLHEHIVRYAERLTATLPEPLGVCFLVNSGSEANELAIRLAHAYTGREDLIVVEGAYHGNTCAAVAASPYKFDGPGGEGAAPHIHPVTMPDDYRGPYHRSDPRRGRHYAKLMKEAVAAARRRAHGPAAFICESLLSCGGQVELPPGYLEEAYVIVRDAGGICIADEVQVGFGRVGTHFWGFETQGVVPDIVTMGKPIGNGHPLGAVVTTPDIAQAFANGMEYFNTFGGNPVSCAVGLAVLDVIEDEGLQRHALDVGTHLLDGLLSLQNDHGVVGDVRGLGLLLGVELVCDRTTREPDADVATYVVERMKDHGILLSTDGPHHNVIKIKPPMVFTEADADRIVEVMDRVLAEDFVIRAGRG